MVDFRLVDHRRATVDNGGVVENHIHNKQDLVNELVRLTIPGYAEFTCFLPGKGELWVYIADEYAIVEFISESGEPPYLIVAPMKRNFEDHSHDEGTKPVTLPLFDFMELGDNEQKRTKAKLVEFNIGGTPTHIPTSQCVSLQEMIDIVVHFFQYQELSKEFQWKPI